MPRGTSLSLLTEMVQDESRTSSATSRGVDHRAYLQRLIKRVQQELYDDYDWPFMRITRDAAGKDMAAGQRYYDFPTALNPDRISRVWHQFGGLWTPLDQGITPAEYNAYDSDADVRADPPQKWDWYGESQFEVWPLPASANGEVRFEGMKSLTLLSNDAATADLDDHLIVLFCAAEVLAPNNQKDASLKLQKAQRRLATLRGNLGTQKRVVFGARAENGKRRETTLRVVRAV